jgi:hypothetical protein
VDNRGQYIKILKFSLLLTFLVLCYGVIIGQEPESKVKKDEAEIIDKIENIAESHEANLDYTDLIADLAYLQENPLNLNYVTDEDLRKLIFLNNFQIYNLLGYRETYGFFITVYEIQAIDGFDQETIQKILPYVYVSEEKRKESISFKNIAKYGRNEFIMRYQRILQEQKGYAPIDDSALFQKPNSRYLGSPDKIYLRYGFNYFNKVRFGFTAEKDAGEVFLKDMVHDSLQNLAGTNLHNGFDFLSFHVSLRDIGILKALTVGDYQLEFGQGLTLWSGLAFGKSSDALNIKRFARGLRPNTSANENLYFRGIATTIGFKNIDITAFYSSHKVDANLVLGDTLSDRSGFISALQESGLHRTLNELLDRKSINIQAIGGNINYLYKRFKIGVTSYYSKLSTEILKEQQLYGQYDFSGTENLNVGLDYRYLFNKINIFGEIAVSQNGGLAQLHGLMANLHPRFSMTILYRNYQKDYQNFYSNAFAENSYNRNEKGVYTGVRFNVHRNWFITAYLDNFSFPWIKYRVDAPSKGNEYLIQLENSTIDKLFYYFRFRQKNKQINEAIQEDHIQKIITTRKNYFRFHIEYLISATVQMKNRVEFVIYKEGNVYRGTGYLIYQDIAWRTKSEKLTLICRYALFDTDSYDERIYAYENDVLYAFSVPAYYYNGMRGIILLNFKLTKKINFWVRFAHTFIGNRSVIGTGLDEIHDQNRSEIKIQLRVKI